MTKTFDWYDKFRAQLSGLDLESELAELLSEIGEPVFVRRADHTARCECTAFTGEPDPNCNICGGSGFLYKDIPALCYMWQGSVIGNDRVRNTDGRYTAYLASDADFKEIDRIIKVQLDRNGKVLWPPLITSVLIVKSVEVKRGDNKSNVVFYQLEVGDGIGGNIIEA